MLLEKNTFIETLLDSSLDMIYVFDRELRHVSLNKKAREFYKKYFAEDVIGKTIDEVNPSVHKSGVYTDLQQALNDNIIHRKEFRSTVEEKYYDIDYIPIRNENGVYAVMVITRDVTLNTLAKKEIEQANQDLKKRNEFIETIINESHEYIAVYDKDLRLMTMNPACEVMLGIKKEDILGKYLQEIFPAAVGTKSETDLRKAMAGEVIRNEPFYSPVTGRYIQNYITPLRDNNGQVYAALAIANDITEIKKAEDKLKQSQEHFYKIFNVSPVAMSISNTEKGTVVDVNEAWERLFGLNRTEVIGKNAAELQMTDPVEREEQAQQLVQSVGKTKGMELKFKLRNGRNVYTYTSIETIEINGAKSFLAAYFDISDRKHAEQEILRQHETVIKQNNELEKINHELQSFTYVASHDLQEPLRKIIMFTGRILEKDYAALSEEGKNFFGRIENAASRMQRLIADLLAYSRADTALKEFESVKLDTLLDEVKDNLKEKIAQTNTQIKAGKLPELKMIRFQFRQLFTNIITNAIKFSKPGQAPEIKITASVFDASKLNGVEGLQKKKYHLISIADNGVGFAKEYNEKVFGLFQRLHGQSEFEGSGIGLAICKKIVENHNGVITAHGEENKGAVFNIYMPA